ncbi:hypothetical protein R6Q59_034474 [Mikania micrantha]
MFGSNVQTFFLFLLCFDMGFVFLIKNYSGIFRLLIVFYYAYELVLTQESSTLGPSFKGCKLQTNQADSTSPDACLLIFETRISIPKHLCFLLLLFFAIWLLFTFGDIKCYLIINKRKGNNIQFLRGKKNIMKGTDQRKQHTVPSL